LSAVTLDELLAEARSHLDRVEPPALQAEMAIGAVVVDIRPVEQRQRDGPLPGAIVVDRNVLEWRLAPSSEWRIEEVTGDPRQRVVLVCNEGFSSSLAARTLQLLGLVRATDLVGGFQAWQAWGDAATTRSPSTR
jgi:rhodanese-related sulfurtransferase